MVSVVRKKNMVNKLGALGAVVALSLGGLIVGAAPAQAAAPSDCRLGDTCLYSGYNFTNDAFQNPGKINFSRCIDRLANYFHNNVDSSVYNNGRSENSYLYDGEYATGGTPKLVLRGQGIGDLGAWNDRASSAYFSSQIANKGTAWCN